MTDPKAVLQELYARGITTLEQFVKSEAQKRKPQRIDSKKALEAVLARSASDSSVKSQIGQPSSSVTIVLDDRRVDYNAIAQLNGQPLDYVATTLKGGEQALVVFSDRSIVRNHLLSQLKESIPALNNEVNKALIAGGLQPSPLIPRIEVGLQIFEDINYGGSSWTLAPEEYYPDLTEIVGGLGLFGGNWNDKISSVQMARCYCAAWENIESQGLGASLTLYQDTPNLHILGWGDRISAIYAPFRN
jgi:hypothetical protein